MFWAILSIFTVIGGGLLLTGIRGRRIQCSPSCRRCRFTLVGLDPKLGRCPECGAATDHPKAIRTERRVPRWRLVVPGLVVLLPAGFGVGYRAGLYYQDLDINFQRHKPAMMLCIENRFGEDESAEAAFREIARRVRAGELSRLGMRSVARHVLWIQADMEREWEWKWGDLMDRAREQGVVRDAHWRRYVEQAFHATITPRSVVRVGDPVTYKIETEWRYGQTPPLAVVLIIGNAVIDETLPPTHEEIGSAFDAGEVHAFLVQHGGYGAFRTRVLSERHSYGGPRPILPRPSVPGRALLRVPVRLEYYDLSHAERLTTLPSSQRVKQVRARGSPVLSHTLVFAAATEVVPRNVESPMLVDDAAVGEQLHDFLDNVLRGPPEGVRLADRNRVVSRRATEPDERLPVPVAFELIARKGEEEARIGVLRGTNPFGVRRGADFVWFRPLPDHFELKRVDLILRPDPEAARHTVELTEVWGGEIILRDFIVDGWQPPRESTDAASEPGEEGVAPDGPAQENEEGGSS